MADFVIIPDSSSDFTKDLRDRFGVPDVLRGMVYFPDGHAEACDVDWEKYNPKDFFESMRSKKVIYKTATAPTGDIKTLFEKHLKEGKDIISLSLSRALSGTHSLCEMAKKELLKQYPDRKIYCLDSNGYSGSMVVLIIMALKLKEQGASIDEVAQYIEKTKYCIHQMGSMDDLFFLVKTGRISNFKAFFGSLMGINPMADFNREGLSQVIHKFKGKKAAFDATLEYIKKTIIDPQDQIIVVCHSNREQQAQLLAQRIRDEIKPKEVIINHIGMSCGPSIGPGLCAAYYYGTEISEGLENEQKIMASIANDIKNRGKN